MRLFLLRHGKTMPNIMGITQDFNDEVDLTKQALHHLKEQLPKIRKTLSDTVMLLSSPMKRAQTTENIVYDALKDDHDIVRNILTDMHEVDFGAFGGTPEDTVINGETMSMYREATKQFYATSVYFAFPEGENAIDVHNRCQSVLQYIASNRHFDGDIVLIGHNRFFRHLLTELGIWTYVNMFDAKLPHSELVELSITEDDLEQWVQQDTVENEDTDDNTDV